MLSEKHLTVTQMGSILCFFLNCDVASKQSFIVSEEHKWRTIIIMVATFSSLLETTDSSSLIIPSLTQHLSEDIKFRVVWVIASESRPTHKIDLLENYCHIFCHQTLIIFPCCRLTLSRSLAGTAAEDFKGIDKRAGKEKVSLFII